MSVLASRGSCVVPFQRDLAAMDRDHSIHDVLKGGLMLDSGSMMLLILLAHIRDVMVITQLVRDPIVSFL